MTEARTCAMPQCESMHVPGKLFCAGHVGPDCAASMMRHEPKVAGSQFCAEHQEAASRPRQPTGSSALVSPHCQVRGQVRSKQVKVKRGVSGGKATGAVLTGGLSLLATGLSRKEHVTQCMCGNCGMTWNV
jgi:hypothetical protein